MSKNKYPPIGTKELVETFSNIDGRISELHKHSTGVFMQLNNYLKDYYKKINTISENASRIFDTLLGDEKNSLSAELDNLYNEIRDYRALAEEENKRNVRQLKEINLNANSLSVAIRNFKQDLITFSYLTTNFHLISNYENFNSDCIKRIAEWENQISKIQPFLSGIGKEFDILKYQIDGYLEESESSGSDSSHKISALSDDIKLIYHNVQEKTVLSETFFPVIKEKSKSSSDSIGNIITHLQYHDIIRQKIEHIQEYHQNIINAFKLQENGLPEFKEEQDAQRFGQIADIVGLQADQLMLVSREYQNALEIITRNFQIIAADINTISNISYEFCSDGKNKEVTLLTQVKNKLDEGILMLDVNNVSILNEDLLYVKETIQNIHKHALNAITEPLTQLEKVELFKENNSAISGKNPSIIHQISRLSRDISTKKNDLQTRIEELLEMSSKLKTSEDNDGRGSRTEQEQIRLMVKVTKILDSLDHDNMQLDLVLSQNEVLNQDIINEIEGTINKVDYYELFERVLNNVIEKLNYINSRLRIEKQTESLDKSAQSLHEIESLYTVATERKIHENYLKGDGFAATGEIDDAIEDIELF